MNSLVSRSVNAMLLCRPLQRLPAVANKKFAATTRRYLHSAKDNATTAAEEATTTTTTTTTIYLHIGPSGDSWLGHSIFAAKHLQPDYVQSIAIPQDITDTAALMQILENDLSLAQEIYDTKKLPSDILEQIQLASSKNCDNS